MRRGISACTIVFAAALLGPVWAQNCVGPSGGRGGQPFEDGGPAGTSITVRSGSEIDGIEFEGNDYHGGNGGNLKPSFVLQPGEVVTGLRGRYGDRIDSLQIITNRRASQRYGGDRGSNDYMVAVPEGHTVVGFCGRSGERLDAIGLEYR